MITPTEIKQNEQIRTYIEKADEALAALGYTEHSYAHVTRVAHFAEKIMADLGYPRRMQELAWIAGYMHDIGNVINRHRPRPERRGDGVPYSGQAGHARG